MKRLCILSLLVASAASSATLPSRNWPAPADRGEALLEHIVLDAHNQARGRFGVAPLHWSHELAGEAMVHAQYMARTGIYGHDRNPERRKTSGENLWRGPRGVFSYETMVGVMIEESRHFRAGVFPNISRTGEWADVAHFTQIVWPTTTNVGCALASSPTTDYFVCRYSPTGNKDGYQLAERRD